MATVNKDFKIKSGLVVEGTTGTINGEDILTKAQADIDYIIGEVGGSGSSTNTPDTLVLRDGSGNFAAGTITADLTGDVTGTVSDISNHDTDDLSEGTTNKYYTDARVKDVLVNSTQTNVSITEIAGELHITAENGVADSNTDDLTEGTTNKYFTDGRAVDAISAKLGQGIEYSGTAFDVQLGTGLTTDANNAIEINRTTVDAWYDAAGSAGDVATDLSTHEQATTAVHGVTGNIVGTSDSQTITNKTFDGTTYFGTDNTNSAYIQAETDAEGDLTVHAGANLTLSTSTGDIVLNPDGTTYIGSATAGNEVATHGYVDNAVAGLTWKQSVNVLANANVALTGSTPLSIDSHEVANGYRVLLIDQDTAAENGIYDAAVSGGSYTLTRSTDADAYTELVGASVYVMEGTQFGSTSWVQGNHYLSDFTGQTWTQFSGQGSVTAGNGITVNGLEVSIDTNVVATQSDLSTGLSGKQNNLTAGTNISIANDTVSVTGLASTDISDFATAAQSAGTGYFDPAGAADTAEDNANTYTDTALQSYTTTANLETTIDGYGFAYTNEIPSTTDDLTEGATNHYYTDARSQAATADLLTSATLSNITITGDEISGLTITAENGVAGSTTDDLTEGSSNLYFTDQRALDAVANSTIYPNIVDINDYRREEATQQYVGSASTVVAHSFTGNRSVKYLARVVGTVSGTLHSQVTELLVTVDGNNNVAVTEYGSIHTTEPALATFTADYNSGSFRLLATTAVAGCEVVVAATLLSWAD